MEGVDLRNMLLFANERLADAAYRLVIEDDQCSKGSMQAVTIAHKFVNDGIKYVLGFACSGAVLAAAPVYEKGGVVVIALAAGAPQISGAGEYIFRTIPNLNSAADKLYAHAEGRYKSVGIISEETDYCQGLAAAFKKRNASGALRIEAVDYLPGAGDFQTILAALRKKGVEALFLNPQTEQGMIALYRDVLDLRWKAPVLGAYYPGFEDFLKTFGRESDGVVYADLPFISSALGPEASRLYADYQAAYGAPKSSEFYFVTAISAFLALHEALTKHENVKDYLHRQKFKNIMGEYSFNANGDVAGETLSFVLKKNADGRPVPLGPEK